AAPLRSARLSWAFPGRRLPDFGITRSPPHTPMLDGALKVRVENSGSRCACSAHARGARGEPMLEVRVDCSCSRWAWRADARGARGEPRLEVRVDCSCSRCAWIAHARGAHGTPLELRLRSFRLKSWVQTRGGCSRAGSRRPERVISRLLLDENGVRVPMRVF